MKLFVFFLLELVFFLLFYSYRALAGDCDPSSYNVATMRVMKVSKLGKGHFPNVQMAINHVPQGNTKWILILISSETYTEKVRIPYDKPCLFLQGTKNGNSQTTITWGDHDQTDTSATFTSFPDNIVARSITFMNSYNMNSSNRVMKPALAARIYGDKSAFYECGFIGIQDTLWDVMGQHYYFRCYIEGAVDFIFGNARSIYENCVINVNVWKYYPRYYTGYITAQKRMSQNEDSGFVFKSCDFTGSGKAFLGRAWGPYSRVIIVDSTMSAVILPEGWDSWFNRNFEKQFTYVEYNNKGPGSDTSRRVWWSKRVNAGDVAKYLSNEYYNRNQWLKNVPNKV